MTGSMHTMTPEAVQTTYERLGYTAGWRFMTAPAANMVSSSVALVGLNPGGSAPHGPRWSQEEGSAYVIESWGGQAPGTDSLQRQVKLMLATIEEDPHRVFSAQFVPFRSPSWDALQRPQEAVAFSRELWAWTLSRSAAKVFLCLGKNVAAVNIADLIGARLVAHTPCGWGAQTIDSYRSMDGRRVLGLPHLGRFQLFGRGKSEVAFLTALEAR
jgi:hypothetical protein